MFGMTNPSVRCTKGLALVVGFLLFLFAGARASNPFGFGPPRAIETGVEEIPPSPGSTVVWVDGYWHLVYAKDGGIFTIWGGGADWSAPVALVPAGSGAARPHIAAVGAQAMVVWEAPGPLGHPEVYGSRGLYDSWQTPAPLSSDAVSSQSPVVGGTPFGSRCVAAWEDSATGGHRIMAAIFDGSAWGAPTMLSPADTEAREPSATVAPLDQTMAVAWADNRDGVSDIYRRSYFAASWQAEQLSVTGDRPFSRPSIVAENFSDIPLTTYLIVCEAPGDGGAIEVWYGRCSPPVLLSADDGNPSERPNIAGFTGQSSSCWVLPGAYGSGVVTWTEQGGGGSAWYALRKPGCIPGTEIDSLAVQGLSDAAVGMADLEPSAGIAQVWIEDVSGVPTLFIREGSTPGCIQWTLEPQTPLLLAPAGIPSTRLRLYDSCSGIGDQGLPVDLWFSGDLEAALAWDPVQGHPYLQEETDADGFVEYSIRGGGCAQGDAQASPGGIGWCDVQFAGAKSPDVDGDCRVEMEDLAYVQSRVGTADYCADLTGDHWVDAEDVAIVESTLGDVCSHLVSGVGGQTQGGPAVRAWPNPCRDRVYLTLGSAGAGKELRIFDAAGRQVRGLIPDRYGRTSSWDLRDAHGRLVPSGVYLVALGGGSGSARLPILVVR